MERILDFIAHGITADFSTFFQLCKACSAAIEMSELFSMFFLLPI